MKTPEMPPSISEQGMLGKWRLDGLYQVTEKTEAMN
jgi:hypothetical protein